MCAQKTIHSGLGSGVHVYAVCVYTVCASCVCLCVMLCVGATDGGVQHSCSSVETECSGHV